MFHAAFFAQRAFPSTATSGPHPIPYAASLPFVTLRQPTRAGGGNVRAVVSVVGIAGATTTLGLGVLTLTAANTTPFAGNYIPDYGVEAGGAFHVKVDSTGAAFVNDFTDVMMLGNQDIPDGPVDSAYTVGYGWPTQQFSAIATTTYAALAAEKAAVRNVILLDATRPVAQPRLCDELAQSGIFQTADDAFAAVKRGMETTDGPLSLAGKAWVALDVTEARRAPPGVTPVDPPSGTDAMFLLFGLRRNQSGSIVSYFTGASCVLHAEWYKLSRNAAPAVVPTLSESFYGSEVLRAPGGKLQGDTVGLMIVPVLTQAAVAPAPTTHNLSLTVTSW